MWQITVETQSGEQADPEAFEAFLDAIAKQLEMLGCEDLGWGGSLVAGTCEWEFTIDATDFNQASSAGTRRLLDAVNRVRGDAIDFPSLRVIAGAAREVDLADPHSRTVPT